MGSGGLTAYGSVRKTDCDLTGQPLSSQLRSVLRAHLMIRFAISAEVFEAIARTLPLGTVRAEFRCMT
jgi:hypothetical protein